MIWPAAWSLPFLTMGSLSQYTQLIALKPQQPNYYSSYALTEQCQRSPLVWFGKIHSLAERVRDFQPIVGKLSKYGWVSAKLFINVIPH
jgi:hypothetical protein